MAATLNTHETDSRPSRNKLCQVLGYRAATKTERIPHTLDPHLLMEETDTAIVLR